MRGLSLLGYSLCDIDASGGFPSIVLRSVPRSLHSFLILIAISSSDSDKYWCRISPISLGLCGLLSTKLIQWTSGQQWTRNTQKF